MNFIEELHVFWVFRFTENIKFVLDSLYFPGLSGTLLIYALVLIGRTDRIVTVLQVLLLLLLLLLSSH